MVDKFSTPDKNSANKQIRVLQNNDHVSKIESKFAPIVSKNEVKPQNKIEIVDAGWAADDDPILSDEELKEENIVNSTVHSS